MALIKCPECGENISNSAKKCIHCGCEVTYCPECGQTFVGTMNVCPACGYNIVPKDVKPKKKTIAKELIAIGVDKEKIQEDLKDNNIIDSFNESSILRLIICKYGFLFKLVFIVIAIATILAAIVKIFTYSITSEEVSQYMAQALTGLLSGEVKGITNEEVIADLTRQAMDTIVPLITASAVFTTFALVFSCLRKIYIRKGLGKWITINNLDVVSAVKKYTYTNTTDMMLDYFSSPTKSIGNMFKLRTIQMAAVYSDTKKVKSNTVLINTVIKILLYLLFVIFAALTFGSIGEARINTMVTNALLQTKSEVVYDYTMLIVTIVMLFVWFIIEVCIMSHKDNKLLQLWAECNLPSEYRAKKKK